ncbi:MAG: GyrI-like domain-containing protein [Chloroflexi bacterium]|nr:GyrI-like domain-containing protein [Chloroflexota bacterium]
MTATPLLFERASQKYIAIRTKISRDEIGSIVPEIYSELSAWISANNISISGAPIIRYFFIDYGTGDVDIDVGFPISSNAMPANNRIKVDEIPYGTYATLIHNGSYENLFETTAMLLAWGRQQGIKWQSPQDSKVSKWKSRIEHYLVGFADTQNPNDWKTEVAILVE